MREVVVFRGRSASPDRLAQVFKLIAANGGTFDVAEMQTAAPGREPEFARLEVGAADAESLDRLLAELAPLGGEADVRDAVFAAAEADGVLPDDFYATSNYDTFVRVGGSWVAATEQKMDCALVLRAGVPVCVKQRKVKRGEPVLLQGGGVRVRTPERARGGAAFGFMSNDVSAEINKGVAVRGIAAEIRKAKAAGEKIVVVAGPAIIHSGGDAALAGLVRDGWIDVLLAGNAFAVHDLEKAVCGTSLGVCQKSGRPVAGGSRNHLFTINAVNRAGGVRGAVSAGLVKHGVMFELVRKNAPFVLAGSIRDDGPLKDVVTDALAAQEAYLAALAGCGVCLMLATALHSIAVGNLLPARVRTVCVDMGEATPTKLANRGTTQAVGLVTDVGYFLERLAAALA